MTERERARYELKILNQEIEIQKLKEELKDSYFMIGAIILSHGGEVKVFDKAIADLDKRSRFTRRRDEANQCDILGLK